MQLNGRASKVMSVVDQMRWLRIRFFISSGTLWTKKPMGWALAPLPPCGCGGETWIGGASWWMKSTIIVMLVHRCSTIIAIWSATSFLEMSNALTINFRCSTWNQVRRTLLSRWSKIWTEWAMWTLGKPPMGVGVNWGSTVLWFIPFWLRIALLASAKAR